MKQVLVSITKFILMFVLFFLILNWCIPEWRAQMLADGIPATALSILLKGTAVSVVLIGGTWLLDKRKNKSKE